MVKLGLIRHARTPWNLEKKIQGREDIALSPEGIDQARLWGEVLLSQKYDIILSSPMIRAQQTSQIIAKKIHAGIEYDKGLREQDFGEWEGRKISDIRNQLPGEIEHQESMGWDFCPPGGESRGLVLNRASNAIEKAAERLAQKYILVVSHSSVMKILIYKALGRSFMPSEVPLIKNYHLHVLSWDQKVKVEVLNSIKLY
ncbi:MAG: histidine phosphatase family protein [Desulfobacula sp.]|nr:histidine phosphatase family protein [Desulfobacula sp.]